MAKKLNYIDINHHWGGRLSSVDIYYTGNLSDVSLENTIEYDYNPDSQLGEEYKTELYLEGWPIPKNIKEIINEYKCYSTEGTEWDLF